MSVPDLEDRLRGLRLAEPEPGLAGRALESLHLTRHLRIAWRSAAAAALLAVGVGMSESRHETPLPTPVPDLPQELAEMGVRPPLLVEVRPDPREVAVAVSERRALLASLLEGGSR